MAIDIPVNASFNDGEIKAQIAQINSQIKELGSAVAAANKQKFEPISLRSKDDLKTFVQQTQQLLKVQTELRNRMKETGQAGKMPLAADWAKLYPNVAERNKKLQHVLGFYGNDFEDLAASGGRGRSGRPGRPGHPPSPDHRPPPHTTPRGFWGGVAQSGLGAAGPVGGVAGGALRTGMSAGFGAGLMGLAGGILALGVGKAVGGVYNKIGTAEDNEVAYDTLKRTLGDVNVAFNQLKTVVKGTGDQYRVTYAESARLSQIYSRAGNLSGEDYRTMGGEVGAGIGLSRSYGLDPAQGVGLLGMMRGLGINRNESDTRRFALLIGETIGKSGAFAKADEVMEALASYATNQTRLSLSQNVAGYAGQLSSLIGMGIPGLDVQGSAALMGQVNAALRAGGAKGEASQFFSYGIGARMGLNPFELQMLREGGASATLSSVFGRGSVAAGFGFREREGDETWLGASIKALREQYAGQGSEILASATANHFGITMAQAVAMQQIQEPNMRALEEQLRNAGYDVTEFNASAINAMSQVVSGTADQRLGVARDLAGRRGKHALSSEDMGFLNRAMQMDDEQHQTQALMQLLAKYGQQDTQGKDIRDSKALLDNLNTSIAERLIPLTQGVRDAVMYMASRESGNSPMEIQERMVQQDFDQEIKLIDAHYLPGIQEDNRELERLRRQRADPAEIAAVEERLNSNLKGRRNAIDRTTAERDRRLSQLRGGARITDTDTSGTPDSWIGTGSADSAMESYRPGMDPGHGLSGGGAANDALFRALIQQESGGRHYGRDGGLLRSSAGALGITQVMPATGRDPGFGVTPLRNDSQEEYLRFGRDYLNALLRYYRGDKRKALAAYNAGAGSVDRAVKRHGENWLSSMPEETRNYVPSILRMEDAYNSELPHTGSGDQASAGGRISVDDLNVNVSVTGPATVMAPAQLNTRFGPPRATA